MEENGIPKLVVDENFRFNFGSEASTIPTSVQ